MPRRGLRVRLQAEVIGKVVKAHLRIDQIGIGGYFGDRRFLFVVLIPDLADQLLQNILHRHDPTGAAVFIDDDGDIVEPFDLPAVDLSGEELNVTVVPKQADEFTCAECFLVQRRNRVAFTQDDGSEICQDCA